MTDALPGLLDLLHDDGPLPLAALSARLGVEESELSRELQVRGDVHEGADGWHAVDRLADSVVLTHLVTDEELAHDVLVVDVDLQLWGRLAEEGRPLADGGQVRERWHAELGADVLIGPPGWLRGLADGELVALTLRDGVLHLDPVDLLPEPDVGAVTLLVECATELAAADPLDPGALVDEVVLRALERRPGVLRGLLPPLSVLFDLAGLELRGGLVGLPGTDWDGPADVGLDPEQARSVARLRAALLALGRDPDLDGTELAQALERDDDVVAALAVEVAQEPALRPGLAGLPGTGPVHLLRAAVADAEGDVGLAEEHLAAALDHDPGLEPALLLAAGFAEERGDAAGADALLARVGLPSRDPQREQLRAFLRAPADLAGRNRPCACGSGRKTKLCCGATALHPLPARAVWRYARAARFALRAPGSDVVPEVVLALAGESDEVEEALLDPLVPDLALFEGGLLERYLAERGALLPPDERALLEQWVGAPLQLLEVVATRPGRDVTLRPLPDGDVVVVRDRALSGDVERLDVLLGRLLSDGAGPSFLVQPVALPRPWRHRVQAALDTGEAVAVATALATQPPPHLLTREGEDVVVCTARVAGVDDDAWARLAADLEDDDGDLVELVDLDGDRVLRGRVSRDGDEVVVEANSRERMARLRERVLAVGGRLLEQSEVPADRLPQAEGRATPMPAELFEELGRQHEQRWLDEQVPALGGRTPREAAGDPAGRPLLEALLDDFAWQERAGSGPSLMQAARLRAALGL